MTARFYEQPSLNVESYDALLSVVPGGDDIAFIARLAQETGDPLLELACGTGRVTIPLAQAGFDIVGLDRSSAMLDVARAKAARLGATERERVRFVEADMTQFDLPDRFGMVFAVFRGFMLLVDVDAQLAALAAARRHLRPGGILVIDLFDPRLESLPPGTVMPPRLMTGTLPSGSAVEAGPLERTTDPVRQVLVEPWRFVERDASGTTVREELEVLTMRWTYRYEMRHLLTIAGFEPLHEYGDYAGGPPAYAAEQIWVARRPETAE
jgi:ubiquinone/menaquinone biosynthesis C-methylase UbiE